MIKPITVRPNLGLSSSCHIHCCGSRIDSMRAFLSVRKKTLREDSSLTCTGSLQLETEAWTVGDENELTIGSLC